MQWGVPKETVYVVRVIVTELVANAVSHSASPCVCVMVSAGGCRHRPCQGRWHVGRTALSAPQPAGRGGLRLWAAVPRARPDVRGPPGRRRGRPFAPLWSCRLPCRGSHNKISCLTSDKKHAYALKVI